MFSLCVFSQIHHCQQKVLLVLDDVDHIDQLEALANKDWFKNGSRILITTRDEQVLVAHGVNLIRDINLLSEQEAICLFCRYAFGTENPVERYEVLSGKVVRYAAGLPLTIKVLGSFLCGKDMDDWEDAIERLKDIPLKETLEKLELSYIGLEDDYKEMFLDIACILKGKRKEDAIRILECYGFHARNGLKVLEKRSLITISSNTRGAVVLGMHDHLEEMGKTIVRREHPNEPNKHSRLWINEEIEDILANDRGTEATRSLKLNKSYRRNLRIVMKGLRKMKKLQYLEVDFPFHVFEREKLQYLKEKIWYYQFSLPNSLMYLKCRNYPFLYLPKTFQGDNLVGVEMYNSRMVQLRKKVLRNLKFLSLVHSKLKTIDYRNTPNLETLSLENSCDLKELCMPADCQKLTYLSVSNSKLRTFDLGSTPNLETLSLEDSYDLKELCMPASCRKLTYLRVSNSKLRTFDLGSTPNLETLSLSFCTEFVKLHVSAPNLKSLDLRRSRLRSLDLELIPNLERLDLQFSKELVEIIPSVGCLKKVVWLNLHDCALLEKLPKDLGRFGCLKELDITDTSISHLPQSIFGLKGLFIRASRKVLRLYDFPSEITTTTNPWWLQMRKF